MLPAVRFTLPPTLSCSCGCRYGHPDTGNQRKSHEAGIRRLLQNTHDRGAYLDLSPVSQLCFSHPSRFSTGWLAILILLHTPRGMSTATRREACLEIAPFLPLDQVRNAVRRYPGLLSYETFQDARDCHKYVVLTQVLHAHACDGFACTTRDDQSCAGPRSLLHAMHRRSIHSGSPRTTSTSG